MARPWYAFYPADYGRDTGHLSLVEHGAYRALMDHYYATAAPLPADLGRLLRLCRANAPAEAEAVRYVLAEFFEAGPEGWRHRRIDAEIAKAEDISAKCSIAAKMGAARRQERDQQRGQARGEAADAAANGDADGPPSQSQSHALAPSQEKDKSDTGFAEFWAAYPRREAKAPARKAFGRACRSVAPQILVAAAAAYGARRAGQDGAFTKLPATWLDQECWLDDVTPAVATAAADAASAWAGRAAPLVAEIGPAAFQAYFAAADFAPGPPPRIAVAAPYLRDLIARKFTTAIRRAYGDFALEAA